MPLPKPRVMTPARWAASRRNALKSTGPRIAQGKAQSRMNGLRNGWSSPTYRNLWPAMLEAPPCAVDATARDVLTPEQASDPKFAELVGIFRQAEIQVAAKARQSYGRWITGTKNFSLPERSQEPIENKASLKNHPPSSRQPIENKYC